LFRLYVTYKSFRLEFISVKLKTPTIAAFKRLFVYTDLNDIIGFPLGSRSALIPV